MNKFVLLLLTTVFISGCAHEERSIKNAETLSFFKSKLDAFKDNSYWTFFNDSTIHFTNELSSLQTSDSSIEAYKTLENKVTILLLSNKSHTNKVFSYTIEDEQLVEHALCFNSLEKYQLIENTNTINIHLEPNSTLVYYLIPIIKGVAAIGTLNKVNKPKTYTNISYTSEDISTIIEDGGNFLFYVPSEPARVSINGVRSDFEFDNNFLICKIPVQEGIKKQHVVNIHFPYLGRLLHY